MKSETYIQRIYNYLYCVDVHFHVPIPAVSFWVVLFYRNDFFIGNNFYICRENEMKLSGYFTLLYCYSF